MKNQSLRYLKSWSIVSVMALALAAALPIWSSIDVQAEETAGEKIENTADDARNETKSTVRKGKRKLRDKTGRGSVKEDMKDAGRDAGDSIESGAKKLKRKAD